MNNKEKVYNLLRSSPTGVGTKVVAESLGLSVSDAYHVLSSGVYDGELSASEDEQHGVVYRIKQ